MSQGLYQLDRLLTVLRHRHSGLRHLLPFPVVRAVNRTRARLLALRARTVKPEYRSPMVNLYHCCVHKSGSQWITAVLSDLVTYRHCGLLAHQYQLRRREGYDPRPITERTFDRPFPPRTIVTPLYIDHANYRAMPRPEPHRTLFVQRDPRDVAVSWYFSARYSHLAFGDIPAMRERLSGMEREEGLVEVIRYLEGQGLFTALDSWIGPAATDPDVMAVRYEELAGSGGRDLFRRLMTHLDIRLPEERLRDLVDAYSFTRLSGRKQGEADPRSHVRKGGAGDWRRHFTPPVEDAFREATGDLVERLGYA